MFKSGQVFFRGGERELKEYLSKAQMDRGRTVGDLLVIGMLIRAEMGENLIISTSLSNKKGNL